MISGFGSFANAAAIVTAAYFGRNLLSEAKAQKQSERQMEQAENILATAYRLKSAMDHIRNPMSTNGDLNESKKDLLEKDFFDGLSEAEKTKLIQANVFFVRLRNFDADFEKAYDLLPYAKAYFGTVVSQQIENFFRSRNSVKVYADAYATDRENDLDFTQKIRAMIWKIDENDELSKSDNDAISRLEEVLLPVIRLPDTKKSSRIGWNKHG